MGKNTLSATTPALTDLAERFRFGVRLVHIRLLFSLQADLLLVSVYWAYIILRVYGVYARSMGASVCLGVI